MTDEQNEALIRADELEAIGAESSLARAMAAHTIRLLYKENEALRAALAQPEREWVGLTDEERKGLAWGSDNGWHCVAITEAKLKEKNA
jgi:hypothetical protein